MRVAQSEERIEIWAPAKLNLFLEVLSRRPDGYHAVETLMMPINLYDTVQLCRSPERTDHLTCRLVDGIALEGDGPAGPRTRPQLPTALDNLVLRAMQRMQDITGPRPPLGAWLTKRIPLQAGLGGASSDAAAALRAVALWGGPESPPLEALAAELGSDVPFFLHSGPAWCRGRGEMVEPVAGIGRLQAVVVTPPAGLATGRVYQAVQVPQVPRDGQPLVAALRDGNLPAAGKLLFNRLQEAAGRLSPWIERLQRAFGKLDVLGHQMSGSGSSYFGLCRSRRHAQRIAAQLRAMRLGSVMAVETLSADPP
jgi:4-diphosphocytidyl-2-C-methyl-D-erythritol kinase